MQFYDFPIETPPLIWIVQRFSQYNQPGASFLEATGITMTPAGHEQNRAQVP